jgi:hypothetical protein
MYFNRRVVKNLTVLYFYEQSKLSLLFTAFCNYNAFVRFEVHVIFLFIFLLATMIFFVSS